MSRPPEVIRVAVNVRVLIHLAVLVDLRVELDNDRPRADDRYSQVGVVVDLGVLIQIDLEAIFEVIIVILIVVFHEGDVLHFPSRRSTGAVPPARCVGHLRLSSRLHQSAPCY